jgi:hypothetical protein
MKIDMELNDLICLNQKYGDDALIVNKPKTSKYYSTESVDD